MPAVRSGVFSADELAGVIGVYDSREQLRTNLDSGAVEMAHQP